MKTLWEISKTVSLRGTPQDTLDRGEPPVDQRRSGDVFASADRKYGDWRKDIRDTSDYIEAEILEQRSEIIALSPGRFRWVVRGLTEGCDTLRAELLKTGRIPWGPHTVVRQEIAAAPTQAAA